MEYIDKVIAKIPCLEKLLLKLHIRDIREHKSKERTVFISNEKPPGWTGQEALKYADNKMVTSKYTLLTFIPQNLFEQFRRIANFYFLVNAIIMFIIPDPPTSPYGTLLPLILVIGVTAIKQAYEDVLRHKADIEVNYLKARVLRNGKFTTVRWRNIQVGDIVEIKSETMLPCDVLLVMSKLDNGTCFVKTANLDGETNLKMKRVPKVFDTLHDEEDLIKLRACISCDKPNTRLYEFKGTLTIDGKTTPLTNENILLRGMTLSVAPVVYGVAVYTGKDTKMMLNSKFKANKRSCVEKRLNRYVFIFIVLLLVLSFYCFGASFAFADIYSKAWYLAGREPVYFYSNPSLYYFILFIFFCNLNYIIPLSLYVTLELQRFIGSRFFEWDIKMYDSATNAYAKVNSTDLNEDLGQIEYLFSDKTGTLTENEMIFKHFSVGGKIYEELNGGIYEVKSGIQVPLGSPLIAKFIEALSLCHTVYVDKSSKERYQASSPDEFAFIKFCEKLGVVYEGEEKENKADLNSVRRVSYIEKPNFKPREKKYEVLQILEFDSTRKRMSVILKDLHTNEYVLFCKGAEAAIFKKSIRGDIDECNETLKLFADQGWRTLVLSYKIISKSQYEAYEKLIADANQDFLNREQRLLEVFEEVEKDLILIGATAVEDKLQDDVESTLVALREAGIKIWVLTGDKLETAVNISYSCRHFSKKMHVFMIAEAKTIEEISQHLDHFAQTLSNEKTRPKSMAMVIDGGSLLILFESKSKELLDDFTNICLKCDAVLCCRMSPSQKAQIVRLVKKSKYSPMTAAIGDGANDVSMIQEANVGLGIFGKEGRNAARSADFAFAKFRFLKRALLVHGYLYYTRASSSVFYFFYKNLVFAICQAYYAYWNAFSATSLYNTLYVSFYNTLLTSVPVLVFGLFEQKYSIKILLKNPGLYKTIKHNKMLTLVEFFKWMAAAVWHSLVAFLIPFGMHYANPVFFQYGYVSSFGLLGVQVLLLVVLLVHGKLLIEWKRLTPVTLISYMLSLMGFVLICILPSVVIVPYPLTLFTDNQALYFVCLQMLSSPIVWFSFFLACVIALTPDVILKVFENIMTAKSLAKYKRMRAQDGDSVNSSIGADDETDSDEEANKSSSSFERIKAKLRSSRNLFKLTARITRKRRESYPVIPEEYYQKQKETDLNTSQLSGSNQHNTTLSSNATADSSNTYLSKVSMSPSFNMYSTTSPPPTVTSPTTNQYSSKHSRIINSTLDFPTFLRDNQAPSKRDVSGFLVTRKASASSSNGGGGKRGKRVSPFISTHVESELDQTSWSKPGTQDLPMVDLAAPYRQSNVV